jgi:hypothetical protein
MPLFKVIIATPDHEFLVEADNEEEATNMVDFGVAEMNNIKPGDIERGDKVMYLGDSAPQGEEQFAVAVEGYETGTIEDWLEDPANLEDYDLEMEDEDE